MDESDMERIKDIYRPAEERKGDWKEVETLLPDAALKEQTSRCMNCGQPFCHAYGCPLGNLVPDQNRAVAQGNWRLAYELLSEHSDFPEFTSRICPALCEASCVHGLDEEAVMIRQYIRSERVGKVLLLYLLILMLSASIYVVPTYPFMISLIIGFERGREQSEQEGEGMTIEQY